MSNVLKSALKRGFPRAANQLSYQREFISLDKIKIHIPGGLHYEAFDNTGCKPRLKSLFLLFESARSYSFWPVSGAMRPDDSFADFHKLLMENYFFIVSSKMEINQSLYRTQSPKFPLTITNRLCYIGDTSHCLYSELESPDEDEPYVKCYVQTVLVDPKTRRPTSHPEWWRQKYVPAVKSNTALKLQSLTRPENAVCFPHSVYFDDTDSYRHTNWVSYVRFCYDACMDSMWRKQYANLQLAEAEKGVKSAEITFKKESTVGDRLDVYSWENSEPNELNFEIMKGRDVCCQAKISFHTEALPD